MINRATFCVARLFFDLPPGREWIVSVAIGRLNAAIYAMDHQFCFLMTAYFTTNINGFFLGIKMTT